MCQERKKGAGPKLVQELTGAARRLVAGQPAGWVAYRGGVTTLMDHLRQALGKLRVNEVTPSHPLQGNEEAWLRVYERLPHEEERGLHEGEPGAASLRVRLPGNLEWNRPEKPKWRQCMDHLVASMDAAA